MDNQINNSDTGEVEEEDLVEEAAIKEVKVGIIKINKTLKGHSQKDKLRFVLNSTPRKAAKIKGSATFTTQSKRI